MAPNPSTANSAVSSQQRRIEDGSSARTRTLTPNQRRNHEHHEGRPEQQLSDESASDRNLINSRLGYNIGRAFDADEDAVAAPAPDGLGWFNRDPAPAAAPAAAPARTAGLHGLNPRVRRSIVQSALPTIDEDAAAEGSQHGVIFNPDLQVREFDNPISESTAAVAPVAEENPSVAKRRWETFKSCAGLVGSALNACINGRIAYDQDWDLNNDSDSSSEE